MIIIGCDYHPSFEQIAFVDTETGELQERRLQHREEAEKFYRDLAAQRMKVRVGMEASGHARWFERLLSELQFELWIGDAAEISARRVRKQKTDRQDAQLILKLMLKDDFPQIWVPSWENRDLRQLLWHRHRIGAGAHTDDESVASWLVGNHQSLLGYRSRHCHGINYTKNRPPGSRWPVQQFSVSANAWFRQLP